jgi:hypothetical protein
MSEWLVVDQGEFGTHVQDREKERREREAGERHRMRERE